MHAVPTAYKSTKTARDRTTGTGSSVQYKKRSYSVASNSTEKRWNYALHRMEIRVTIGLGKNKNSIESDVNSIAFALEMYATLYKRSQFETALVHVYGIASEHQRQACWAVSAACSPEVDPEMHII